MESQRNLGFKMSLRWFGHVQKRANNAPMRKSWLIQVEGMRKSWLIQVEGMRKIEEDLK